MRLAAITFSKSGVTIGRRLKSVIADLDLYLKEELVSAEDDWVMQKPFSSFVGKIFTEYDGLIFIMATGIVVREIAPYVQNKLLDPAVVVIDDLGQYVISLLSGHLGGANALTRRIAAILEATPVITTSTDVHRVPAFDLLASEWGMKIELSHNLKYISGALIDGENIGLFSDCSLPTLSNLIEESGTIEDFLAQKPSTRWKGVVLITSIVIPQRVLKDWNIPLIILRPRNLVLGMGFRRGKSKAELLTAVEQACELANVSRYSIAKVTTIDLKAEEPGVIELCQDLNIPLEIFSREEVKAVEDQFPSSIFVQQTIGVGAVAEPCAFLGTRTGEWILRKERLNGVTVAIRQEKNFDIKKVVK